MYSQTPRITGSLGFHVLIVEKVCLCLEVRKDLLSLTSVLGYFSLIEGGCAPVASLVVGEKLWTESFWAALGTCR
jgi:hypothetical protein